MGSKTYTLTTPQAAIVIRLWVAGGTKCLKADWLDVQTLHGLGLIQIQTVNVGTLKDKRSRVKLSLTERGKWLIAITLANGCVA